MKGKTTKVAIFLAAFSVILVIAIVIGIVYIGASGYVKNFNFTDSESVSVSDIEGKHHARLNGEDKAFIEKFCSVKHAVNGEFETPACFFDTVIITIVKDGKTYTVYPSGDDCHNLAINYDGKHYYGDMSDSFDTFKKLLQKNSIGWNW